MIENLAYECRMPLCYGGGIKSPEQAQRIFNLGVEKIAISSAAIENPNIVSEIAERVGNQSVVVVLDIKKKLFGNKYSVLTHNGKKESEINPFEFAKRLEVLGAGEIVINSIDNDGVMKGYDFELINRIRDEITIPMTVLGGAGCYDDLGEVIKQHGIIGVAAGSLFVFKGKFRAVLINYPTQIEKNNLLKMYFNEFQEKDV